MRVVALPIHIVPHQVKEYISSPDKFGDSLLSYAVKSGSTDMFTFAIDAISKDLTKQEVRCDTVGACADI